MPQPGPGIGLVLQLLLLCTPFSCCSSLENCSSTCACACAALSSLQPRQTSPRRVCFSASGKGHIHLSRPCLPDFLTSSQTYARNLIFSESLILILNSSTDGSGLLVFALHVLRLYAASPPAYSSPRVPPVSSSPRRVPTPHFESLTYAKWGN